MNPFTQVQLLKAISDPGTFQPKASETADKELFEKIDSAEEALSRTIDLEKYLVENPKVLKKYLGPKNLVLGYGPIASLFMAYIDPNFEKVRETHSQVLKIMNPERKLITGAQASYKELAKMIAPMFPDITQDYNTFYKRTKGTLYGGYKNLSESKQKLENLGYNPSQRMRPETLQYLNFIDSMTPDQRKLYFGRTEDEKE